MSGPGRGNHRQRRRQGTDLHGGQRRERSGTQPTGVILGAGAQLITPSSQPESAQGPGTRAPVGSFSVTQLGDTADKTGKDDNFRGVTIFDNVLYYIHQGQRR